MNVSYCIEMHLFTSSSFLERPLSPDEDFVHRSTKRAPKTACRKTKSVGWNIFAIIIALNALFSATRRPSTAQCFALRVAPGIASSSSSPALPNNNLFTSPLVVVAVGGSFRGGH
ncbi:hypothetical protein L596_016086 [Steinernema carpocapsae]|uniref:Uncharacterized protein n=1 Tax=Steinernema carpocapsae TaxID=34508 RepID=A0A4U5NGY6_STECR|nr:hypothetical protein L596_016086 [Steinernema carpocapsae]